MPESVMITRLLLACLFGGAIGYLREIERKTAGLRTHILVCLGSALIMVLSLYICVEYKSSDAGRIAAGVITGIGFLGAGAIIREPGSVKGLTTAASIWVTSAIGLVVGSGYYFAATTATVLTLIVIYFLRTVEQVFLKKEGD